MNGKIVVSIMVTLIAIFGGVLWYTQTQAYYVPVQADAPAAQIRATTFADVADPLPVEDFEGIDADTSPLRFRACFTTPLSLPLMTETYQPYPDATPLVAPDWFGCFDARDLTEQLSAGTALAFMGEENYVFGFDRIVLVTETGQGYAWHQMNHCGEAVFDGQPAPEGCPLPPDRN